MIKKMKLKYVLLSGLFISAFSACTNEDFTEVSTPVNTGSAIALGEGYTVQIGKDNALTKALFNDQYNPTWEKTDTLGAAWVHMVTEFDENYDVITCSPIGGSYGGFYSNHPFSLTAGEGTNSGTFKTVTNAFAGAYVLYYPYDKNVAMTGSEIPVGIKSYEFDAENTLKHVSENMFSYCPVKFVPGGNQTGEFHLNQIPVLFRLSFRAAKELNMDLSKGGITIKNIVLEAKKGGLNGQNVLVADGKIIGGTEPDEDCYNEINNKNLNNIVKYTNDGNVDHLFITVSNSENDDYKLLEKDVLTKKPFIFSTLPLSAAADYVTIKVVTDKGVYAKTYDANVQSEKAVVEGFNRAAYEGGKKPGETVGQPITLNVTLNVTVQDDVIYTTDTFMERWEEAIASEEKATLEVGTDLVLPEGLTCENVNADITVKGHKLTIPSLNFAKAKGIAFENEEVEVENVMSSGSAEITIKNLIAKNVEIAGQGTLRAKNIETLTVASSGVVSLSGVDADSKVKTINIEEGSTVSGTLNLDASSLQIGTLTGAAKSSLFLSANMTNKGNMTLGVVNTGTYTFTNEGTISVKGQYSGKITNSADATATFDVDGSATITNNGTVTLNGTQTGAVTNTKDAVLYVNKDNSFRLTNAGTVNIAKDAELTAATGKTVANTGIINVTGKLTETATTALTQTAEDAQIVVKDANAKITMFNSGNPLAQGCIIILNDNNIVNGSSEPTVFEMTSATATVADAATIWVKYNAKSSELASLLSKNLTFYNNLELTGAMTIGGNFIVAGNTTVTAKAAYKLTITKDKVNEIKAGAKLALSKNVTIAGSTTGTKLIATGDFSKGEGTIDASLSIN